MKSHRFYQDLTKEELSEFIAEGRKAFKSRNVQAGFATLNLVQVYTTVGSSRRVLCRKCADTFKAPDRVAYAGEAAALRCENCDAFNVRFEKGHQPLLKHGDLEKQEGGLF